MARTSPIRPALDDQQARELVDDLAGHVAREGSRHLARVAPDAPPAAKASAVRQVVAWLEGDVVDFYAREYSVSFERSYPSLVAS